MWWLIALAVLIALAALVVWGASAWWVRLIGDRWDAMCASEESAPKKTKPRQDGLGPSRRPGREDSDRLARSDGNR